MPFLNLRVLSVGHGDLTLKFDSSNPDEKKRAESVINDLIRKGYAIMVETGRNEKGPLFQRVSSFDPETSEYLVFGDPPIDSLREKSFDLPASSRRSKPKEIRVPSSAPAVAVARTAGGYDPVIPARIRRVSSLKDLRSSL